ncbi:MAG TPA: L,D-transpeptidase family protein [Sphingomicrobium sp.]|nr:L,D-transpeptidase family protein [Sphingomicrobium sp.]
MESLRNRCTGPRPVHSFQNRHRVAAALIGAAALLAPVPAAAQSSPGAPAASVASVGQTQAGQSVADFYKSRADSPLWLAPQSGDAALKLLTLLNTASIDGLSPAKYDVPELQKLLDRARAKNKRKDVERADEALSQAFVAYVDDLRQDPGVGITWVDPDLRPKQPTALAALLQAAAASSLPDYVANLGWMHPFYGELRDAIAQHKYSDDHQREILALNLERVRVLPSTKQRYVLVNAAQQRLFMYDDGKQVDNMVVVVGQTKYPTPMLAAYIRYAALNPYWYVPPDLAWEDVGRYVVKDPSYFDRMGYEEVSDWTKDAQVLDSSKIDWKGVHDGSVQVLLRQKPGPENFMGRIKFMFPNQFGVYLHDNPRRNLFKESVRYFSGGCVRLEDAWRLERWLFHRELTWEGHGTEEPVMLDQPVPVYITYLTAVPDGQSIAYYDDAYGRDKAKLASTDSGSDTASGAAASR